MVWPTKTLASLGGRMEDLPVRFYSDENDSNPFAKILDEKGVALAFGINIASLVGSTGLMEASHEDGVDIGDPGHVAVGRADFDGAATGDITVTIGAQVYTEAGAEDLPNGVWAAGASGNDSAVSLTAAINGDTRSGALYAAVVLTDTVFITARAIGTAGNAVIVVSAGEPAVVEDLIGGVDAAVRESVVIMHTVTDAEVAVDTAAPQVVIPLPFDPTYFSWQVYDSNGGIYATEMTGRGTITAASSPVPAYFLLANNGAADVQAGDIIRLVVQE